MPLEAEMEARAAPLAWTARVGSLRLGPVAVAAALPVLFLHARFQPGFSISLASTSVDLRLSDLAVLAIAAAAVADGVQRGFAPLRRGLIVWAAAAVFLAYVVLATFYPLISSSGYPWKTHLVTAVKYAEYAVLAPAVPLLLRRRSDVAVMIAALVAVSAVATAVGLAQFFGGRMLAAWPAGGRQPSFVGVDDFGMLSAAAFTAATALVLIGPRTGGERVLAWTGAVAGCLGAVVSGALASILGIVLAAAAAALVAWRWRTLSLRRAVALALMVCAVVGGGIFMRSAALGGFAHFLGLGKENEPGQVDSYSHRSLLDYVGLKIFLRHPVVGAGWQAGYDQETYGPVLPDAHRRFPSQPALAFPSPQHPWGIQNAYVEALAELGVVGFLLFAAWIAAGLVAAARAVLRSRPAALEPALLGLFWILLCAGVWNGLWFIAGIPFDALIWLAFGLAAAGVAAASART